MSSHESAALAGQAGQDRVVVRFSGAGAGTGPLTWGQKAILQDMRDSGGQFSMGGRLDLPAGSTIEDAAAALAGLVGRHPALRMRLATGSAGQLCQEVAGSGELDLHIRTVADSADPARYAADLMDTWPLERFDFRRDLPLRMAVVRQRGTCLHLVWVLSHLAADGGAHLLLLDDLLAAGHTGREAAGQQLLDIARSEQAAQLQQLSGRAMRYWEAQLRHIPAQTFGDQAGRGGSSGQGGQRYWQARFCSPAAHLAMLAIARRTGTDPSRVTLALIAAAIGRATGVRRLTVKVMVNNRFRPGLAEVIAPIAQNSVVTIDVADASVDEVVARARGASLTAGMRAYYDPDGLSEVTARLDSERGYPAKVTCRINDQRAMVPRGDADASSAEVTPEQVRSRLAETSLTWLGVRQHMLEQVTILIENRPGVVSLHLMWDRSCLTDGQVEALLRGVEEVAVEAAFDPAPPKRVPPAATATRQRPPA